MMARQKLSDSFEGWWRAFAAGWNECGVTDAVGPLGAIDIEMPFTSEGNKESTSVARSMS
jgi:hypothetical protein